MLTAPAAAQSAAPERSRWDAWLDAARDLQQRSKATINAVVDYAQPLPRQDGIAFLSPDPRACIASALIRTPLAEAGAIPHHVVIMVHGLDEPGSIWDDLSPVLVDRGGAKGFAAATFTYPDDQPVTASSDMLIDQLKALKARGVDRVDLVCHSMGGLIARDVLTRPDAYAGDGNGNAVFPPVDRLILVGTPLAGSPWARLRAVAELREQIEHWATDKSLDPRQLLGFMNDGNGAAGADLLPGSPFLTDLNARPWPQGVRITAVIGTITATAGPDLSWVRDSSVLRHVMGDAQTDRLIASLDDLAHSLGDGVVSVDSATPRGLPEPSDIVRVQASHRGLLKRLAIERHARSLIGDEPPAEPPAIPIILDRLDGGSQP
jgi:pimeloyl-ACP methyl ester carboxylesterase